MRPAAGPCRRLLPGPRGAGGVPALRAPGPRHRHGAFIWAAVASGASAQGPPGRPGHRLEAAQRPSC